MLWRAHTFRHMVHRMPGQTILELACGEGTFTRQLARVSRGENPITAVTFVPDAPRPADLPPQVSFLTASSLPGPLRDRQFDFVVAVGLLDRRSCAPLLQYAYDALKPGGELLFYETNPCNVVPKPRRPLSGPTGRHDPPSLL